MKKKRHHTQLLDHDTSADKSDKPWDGRQWFDSWQGQDIFPYSSVQTGSEAHLTS
jgi:hypothetical protein